MNNNKIETLLEKQDFIEATELYYWVDTKILYSTLEYFKHPTKKFIKVDSYRAFIETFNREFLMKSLKKYKDIYRYICIKKNGWTLCFVNSINNISNDYIETYYGIY